MTCPTCELLASDTSHADAVQQWECEKAELVNALRSLAEIIRFGWLPSDPGSAERTALATAKSLIRKYEAPQ